MTQLSNVKEMHQSWQNWRRCCMYDSFIDTTLEDLF